MGKVRRLQIGALVLLLAVGFSACGKSKSKPEASGGTKVEAYDFRFDPKTLNVKAGQQVTFTLKNEGKAEHNFSVTSLSQDKDVEGGATRTVSFTAPSAVGDVQFFCKYHKDSHSMVGTLHVTT